MGDAAKLLRKMRNNPKDWRIEDLKVIADSLGIAYRQQGTSHVTFRSFPGRIQSVPCARPIRPVYIRAFLDLVDATEIVQ